MTPAVPSHPVPSHAALPSDLDDLAVALVLADAADAISLPRFGSADLTVTAKPDLTPVTDADLAVEHALRELLARLRPGDAVLGEEFGTGESEPDAQTGQGQGSKQRRWVIDPIDGTKNYVRGVPVWATLIALIDGEDIVVGVVSAPALARRWWARTGGGAFTAFAGGPARPCRVSAVAELSDASLSYSDLAEWEAIGALPAFLDLTRACWRTRAYGDFWSYLLVAEGAADIAVEPDLSLWDLAALVPIVTEAGGSFSDTAGRPAGPTTASALATNGRLHAATVAALGLAGEAG